MLTAAQKTRCLQIAQALDAGDLRLWRETEGSLSAEAKGMVWDLRRCAVAVGQREAAGVTVPKGNPYSRARKASRIETRALDLDYWPDVEAAAPTDDDEPDDDPEEQTRLCPSCGGKGRGDDGDVCEECDGSGRVPIDLDDGD